MFQPIDLTNPDFLFDVIISHQRRIEALETGGTQPTAVQQLKVSIALLQRWLGVVSDLGILTGVNPSLIVETNAVLAQQKTV
jgi:hypothetical protein